MRLRPPATPLITIDPYFSVWNDADELNSKYTIHWTGKEHSIVGRLIVDGTAYRFMGAPADKTEPSLTQISRDMDALTTTYVFEGAGIELTALFTSPILPYDFYYLSRPVSYLELIVRSTDGEEHSVTAQISVSEQICINAVGEDEIVTEMLECNGLNHAKMGSKSQKMLTRNGDYLCTDWGYFYLSAKGAAVSAKNEFNMTWVTLETPVDGSALITFSYDDIKSIEYFGKQCTSYWNRNGADILDEIAKAHGEYNELFNTCLCVALTECFVLLLGSKERRQRLYQITLSFAFFQTSHNLVIRIAFKVATVQCSAVSNEIFAVFREYRAVII